MPHSRPPLHQFDQHLKSYLDKPRNRNMKLGKSQNRGISLSTRNFFNHINYECSPIYLTPTPNFFHTLTQLWQADLNDIIGSIVVRVLTFSTYCCKLLVYTFRSFTLTKSKHHFPFMCSESRKLDFGSQRGLYCNCVRTETL